MSQNFLFTSAFEVDSSLLYPFTGFCFSLFVLSPWLLWVTLSIPYSVLCTLCLYSRYDILQWKWKSYYSYSYSHNQNTGTKVSQCERSLKSKSPEEKVSRKCGQREPVNRDSNQMDRLLTYTHKFNLNQREIEHRITSEKERKKERRKEKKAKEKFTLSISWVATAISYWNSSCFLCSELEKVKGPKFRKHEITEQSKKESKFPLP